MPVIAAVDGHVRAGGLGLVGACDIVVAGHAEHVRADRGPHRRGAVDHFADPAAEDDHALRRPVLPHRARSSAPQEAADDRSDHHRRRRRRATVAALTAAMGKGSPQGLAASKALTTAADPCGLRRPRRRAHRAVRPVFVSEEAREGMLAFLQKRPPRWVG